MFSQPQKQTHNRRCPLAPRKANLLACIGLGIASGLMANPAQALLIDDFFSHFQLVYPTNNEDLPIKDVTTAATHTIGGAREIGITKISGHSLTTLDYYIAVVGGQLEIDHAHYWPSLVTSYIRWDGGFGDGLNGADLTDGGRSGAIIVESSRIGSYVNLDFSVTSTSGDTAILSGIIPSVNTILPFTSFQNYNSSLFSNVNSIEMTVSTRPGLFAPSISIEHVYTGLTISPGFTPDNPIMPVAEQPPSGGFGFEFPVVPQQRTFIDPLVAVGYDYLINSGPNVASVFLPAIGDDLFDLFLWNGADWIFSQVLSAETEFFFGGGGVDRFRILGIETSAGLDPNSSTAFVTGLTFASTGTVNMDMNPLTQETPEPNALSLFAIGLAFLGYRQRVMQAS